nr:immunoglobulin heavy chain junction region [Mus musculus]
LEVLRSMLWTTGV